MAARVAGVRGAAGAGAAGAAAASKEKLVILGTGWAGFPLLSNIDSKKYDVSVVSPRNHLLFTPMLASSAVGTVNSRSICQPVRPVCSAKDMKFYDSSAKKIDKEKQTVLCETPTGDKYELAYDKLVISVGYQPNDFGVPGVKEHALFMKETADAVKFKDHVLVKLEQASYTHALNSDPDSLTPEEQKRIKDLLTFVVVGGGPTGVELAAELTDFLLTDASNNFGHLKQWISVHLFSYDILNMYDQGMQDYASRHLQRSQHVSLHLGAVVQQVTKDEIRVKLENQEMLELTYGTLVWCAGIKPHKFVSDLGVKMNQRGSQILTDRELRVAGEKNIWAMGDCATIEDYWLPQTAQVAKQQGKYLGKVFNQGDAKHQPLFKFQSLGMMCYLGSTNALMASLPGVDKMTGFLAFLGWRSVYWGLQMSLRNRYMLATDWTQTLLFGRDLTRFGRQSRPT